MLKIIFGNCENAIYNTSVYFKNTYQDEWIEQYSIEQGTFDTITNCKYTVPSVTAIGRVYQQLVVRISKENEEAQAIIDVFSSFISDEISDFNSSVYYSNPDYLRCSYEEGVLLA